MKEIKIFIPEETKIEIEKIISNNDKIIINIPKGLKIDLENSNENEIYIVYKNENLIIYDENLIAINNVTYEFTEDDNVCEKCEIPEDYCGDVNCIPSQRKDKKDGYFKIIKSLNKTCQSTIC